MHRFSVALTALLLLSPPVFGEQKVTAGKGGVAVGIQGDHNNVSLNDPEVRRLVAEVLKKQKADDFLKGQVTRSQAEADALKKENEALKQQLAEAVRTTVAASREPNPTPAALTAVQGLEAGDTRPAGTLLAERDTLCQHTRDRAVPRSGQTDVCRRHAGNV